MTEATLFLPGLSPVGGKTITATFDGGKLSSNGGVLILREIERKLGLAAVLSRHIPDVRDRMRITHSYSDMTRARMFAIASGHEDCDDLDVLRSDPALKMACGRLPVSGTDLMSQPTLSRLENAPFWRQLARMGLELIDLFCARFERVPRCIVLDIDDTDDAVHGQQQLALFNTHAGGYCFQPIQIFEATTGRPVLSLLRPGKRPSGEEVEQILRHVIGRIRRNWPAVEIMVRGDSHFATPEVMDLLEEKRCGYIFGLSTNPRLTEIGRLWSEDVATGRALSKTEKMRRFFQTSYAAASWSKPRKVVARVEASEQGSDIRFIVTNLPGPAKVLYEKVYCARGRMENLIKDMKLYSSTRAPTAPPATAGRPISSACSFTWGLTGSCTNSGAPRQNAQSGAQQPSRPSAARSSRSLCASKSSRPASRWRCPQAIRMFKP